jgi:ABC-type transport system involved in cytochrome c biogenesis ATPase subunit
MRSFVAPQHLQRVGTPLRRTDPIFANRSVLLRRPGFPEYLSWWPGGGPERPSGRYASLVEIAHDGVAGKGLQVELENDTVLFGGLDIDVEPGQCAAVIGPNGSGKSTLLRCLYGVQPLSAGDISVGGLAPVESSVQFRRKVAVLFDDSDLFTELTPVQHLQMLAASFRVTLPPLADVLDDAGIADRADVAAGRLSAGQRRRLLLLGATLRPFDVLLLDEPERALDAPGKEWIEGIVRGPRTRARPWFTRPTICRSRSAPTWWWIWGERARSEPSSARSAASGQPQRRGRPIPVSDSPVSDR